MPVSITILGSTGSIGVSALRVLRSLGGEFRVRGLSCHRNLGLLEEQLKEFAPEAAAVGAMDLVITNAIILDHWGIVKADVGVKNGRISGIGKAGNPDIQPGVTIVIGPGTDIIAGEGKILTAGGVDSHIHFIAPQQAEEALCSGTTTLVGGGTGPSVGSLATTVTPGPWYIHRMLEAAEDLPINVGFMGKGNASHVEPLREQIHAGALGLKLHEDWGTTPAAIDAKRLALLLPTMRTVDVLQFCSWSAWSVKMTSTTRSMAGSGRYLDSAILNIMLRKFPAKLRSLSGYTYGYPML